MSFFQRLKLALAFLFGSASLPEPATALPAPHPAPAPPPPAKPVEAPPPKPADTHAAALHLIALLQREGRLLDFISEDITSFPDADVGAAARLVHTGCKKVLGQYLTVAKVRSEDEGATITLQPGYDANRVRLTGNVTGAGPWKGALKHAGWVAEKVALPPVPTSVDVTVLAPAEVELP